MHQNNAKRFDARSSIEANIAENPHAGLDNLVRRYAACCMISFLKANVQIYVGISVGSQLDGTLEIVIWWLIATSCDNANGAIQHVG